jgi:hypothetical protein
MFDYANPPLDFLPQSPFPPTTSNKRKPSFLLAYWQFIIDILNNRFIQPIPHLVVFDII